MRVLLRRTRLSSSMLSNRSFLRPPAGAIRRWGFRRVHKMALIEGVARASAEEDRHQSSRTM